MGELYLPGYWLETLTLIIYNLFQLETRNCIKKEIPPLFKDKKYLVVDEIFDTGETFSKVCNITRVLDCDFASLMSRYRYTGKSSLFVGKLLNHNKWIVFPWEKKDS